MAFVLSGEMLHWEAVSNRDLAEVKRLLAKGGDPNMRCPDSFVQLQASEKFRSGQAQDTGRSLLHHAAWAGDLEVFKAIVEAGGDIDRKRNTVWRPNGGVNGRGNMPMHFAVMYRRVDIVKYLLELGADIDASGEQGYTPLHISVKFNYPELMELLLLSGARTDMITRDEKTARDLAKWGGENTTEAMGDILALFDRCETECKARGAVVGQRYEPGAPLKALEARTRLGGAPRISGGVPTLDQLRPQPEPEPQIAGAGVIPATTANRWQQPPVQRQWPHTNSDRSGAAGRDSLDEWQRGGQTSSRVPTAGHAGAALVKDISSAHSPFEPGHGKFDRRTHQHRQQAKAARAGPMSTRPW